MIRVLLFFLFVVLLAADALNLNLSLAPGLSVKNAILYIIMAAIATHAAVARDRKLDILPVAAPYAVYLVYAFFTWLIVALIIRYPGYDSIEAFLNFKSGLVDHIIVFLVFSYGLSSARDAATLLKIMLWTVIFANFITIVDALNVPDLGLIGERIDGRVIGTIGEPNQFAAFLAMFLPPILGLVFISNGIRRILAALGLAVSLIVFFMTASRGGIVAIVGGSMFAAILLRRYISGKAVLYSISLLPILTVLVVSVIFAVGYGDIVFDRLIGLSTTGDAYSVSAGRTLTWAKALGKMFEQPITLISGYGWDSFRYFPDFNFAPHNGYLKIFFETGTIGLLMVLLAFANMLKIARTGLGLASGEHSVILFAFIFGLLSMMVAIFFVDLATPWIFIWAFAGASMRLAISQRELLTAPTPGQGEPGVAESQEIVRDSR